MGVILQVALPSRVLAAARLQCGAAGAGASRGLGVCAEQARLAARGESARAMEIGDFLGWLGPGGNPQCAPLAFPLLPVVVVSHETKQKQLRPWLFEGPALGARGVLAGAWADGR